MQELFRSGFHTIELHIREPRQIFREGELEITGQQRRAVTNRKPAKQAIADIASRGLEVVDVGNYSARLFDEHPAIIGWLGATCCPFEQLDAQPVFKLQHSSAQCRLLDIEDSCRPRKTLRIRRHYGITQLPDFNAHRTCSP